MTDGLNILMQSDDFYCAFSGVTLESLFSNNQDIPEIQVYMISDGIKETNLQKLSELSAKYNRKITMIDGNEIGKMLASLGVTKHRDSYTTYYRLFADKFIPESVDRLLYLDSDLIIDGSLKQLIDLDLEENVAAMAIDFASKTHKANIGISNRNYYNAGVILFDWQKWKNEKWSDRILHHITNIHSTYPLHDQDLLNILLDGKIAKLEMKYNFNTEFILYGKLDLIKKMFDIDEYYSEEEFTEALNSIIIYHCMQYIISRPWVIGSRSPVKDKWDTYLEQSPWKGFQKIKDNRGFAMKCQGLLYDVLPKYLFAFINRHVTGYLQNKRARQNKLA